MLPSVNLENYTPTKILAAQLLSSKEDNNMTDSDIAHDCQIDVRTLYRWKSSPEFIDLLLYYSELSMLTFVPELFSSLKKAVRQGSTRAMELVLKNRGMLIDKKEVSGNLGLSIDQTITLTQDVLLTEIEELKRKVLASTTAKSLPGAIIEATYEEL